MKNPDDVRFRLLARRTAETLLAAVSRRRDRRVLVVSAEHGVGKTTLLSLIREDLEALRPGEIQILLRDDLYRVPAAKAAPFVFAEGPAMDEGLLSLALPGDWQRALSCSLLVVGGRKTRSSGLEVAAERLRALGIPPVGVVWNEGFLLAPGSLRVAMRIAIRRRWRAIVAVFNRLTRGRGR